MPKNLSSMEMVVLKHYPNPTNRLNPINPNSYQPHPKELEYNGNGCS